jgi:hypothetical protein
MGVVVMPKPQVRRRLVTIVPSGKYDGSSDHDLPRRMELDPPNPIERKLSEVWHLSNRDIRGAESSCKSVYEDTDRQEDEETY